VKSEVTLHGMERYAKRVADRHKRENDSIKVREKPGNAPDILTKIIR